MNQRNIYKVPQLCFSFLNHKYNQQHKETTIICENKCQPACELQTYTITSIDTSSNRSEDFQEDNIWDDNLFEGDVCMYKAEHCKDAAVKITFSNDYYSRILQSAVYPVQSVWAEIGGYMGLLIGASVITVFEFIDLMFRFCRSCLKQCSSKSRASAKKDYISAL